MTTLLKPILYSLVLFLIVGVSAASGLTVTADTVQIPNVGETTTLSIILDEAPNGLSGSNVSVSLDDPAIAEFIDVTYPDWTVDPFRSHTPLPGDIVCIKCADFGNIESGATNINLGTVTVRGDLVGTSAVTVSVVQIDDDSGGVVDPTPVHGSVTVGAPPVADFSATPTSGDAPLAVKFTDQSTGEIDTWSWDFGDGETSTEQNPEHTYAAAGTYTVSLTVTNGVGSDAEEKAGYITVTESLDPPIAAFSANLTTGTAPLAVQFTDQSTGVIDTWLWDFGDGGTSTAQNPEHTYTAAGTYTVSLTATNGAGSDTEEKEDYITVDEPPVLLSAAFSGTPRSGDAPLTVQFTDASSGDPTSWSWDFGDGGTSTAQNPEHTYTAAGTYTVSLTVSKDVADAGIHGSRVRVPHGASLTASNGVESDTETKTDYIAVTEPPVPPVAAFSGTPTSGDAPLTVQFTDASTGNPTSWSWTFGDGGTSTAQNPSHTYTAAGTYTVTLTATNADGSDSEEKAGYISVTEPPAPPVADFSGTPQSGDAPLTVQFTDASTGSPTSWSWDFGDGGTSTAQDPEHTYTAAGTYTVSLTATNGAGSDTEEKVDYITVSPPGEPQDTYSITQWIEHSREIAPLLPVWLGTPGGSDSIQVTSLRGAIVTLVKNGRWNAVPELRGELLAAKLNINAGCDPTPVAQTIALADEFLADHSEFDWFRMSPSQQAVVGTWVDTLRAYNNS